MITNKTKISFKSLGSKQPDFVLFRDKSCADYKSRAKEFLENSSLKAKLFLHDDYGLASALCADGVHFSSAKIENLKKADANLIKIASTHSEYELRKACDLGADFVTFSPIFASPNKGVPKGIKALEYAVNIAKNYDVGVIALGGILENSQIKEVLEVGAVGFASIRYFEK